MIKFFPIFIFIFNFANANTNHSLQGSWSGPSTFSVVEKYNGEYLIDIDEDFGSSVYVDIKNSSVQVSTHSLEFDRCQGGNGLCLNGQHVGGISDQGLYYEIQSISSSKEYQREICTISLTINKISTGILYESKDHCVYENDFEEPYTYTGTFQGKLTL